MLSFYEAFVLSDEAVALVQVEHSLARERGYRSLRVHLLTVLEYLEKIHYVAGNTKVFPVHGRLPETHSAKGPLEMGRAGGRF
jgi:hypothetical protein